MYPYVILLVVGKDTSIKVWRYPCRVRTKYLIPFSLPRAHCAQEFDASRGTLGVQIE